MMNKRFSYFLRTMIFSVKRGFDDIGGNRDCFLFVKVLHTSKIIPQTMFKRNTYFLSIVLNWSQLNLTINVIYLYLIRKAFTCLY